MARTDTTGGRASRRQSSAGVASLSGRRSRKAEGHGSDEVSGGGDVARTEKPAPSGDARAVVTLSPAVAAATRRMGEQMGGIGTTEVVRRGLILLDLMLSLPEDEELVIRNRHTQQVDRLRFAWDAF